MYGKKVKGRSRPLSSKPATKFQDSGYKAAEANRDHIYNTIKRMPYSEPEDVDKKTLNYSRSCRGCAGIGIGLPSSGQEDYGIGLVIYCVTDDDYYRINAELGDMINNVPLYYQVVGVIEAL